MYDISIKNFNNIEVLRGQNLTEELTKLIIEKYSNFPNVTIWKTPQFEPEPEQKEHYAKDCAEFLKNYCDCKSCNSCQFHNHIECECILKVNDPCSWELKEGETE